jgi:CHAT domain-containing protein/tetratricopeptide (TPR) repeat protein
MTHASDLTCPTPETLAAFAEGRLKGAGAAAVVEHLDTCDECTRDVALAMQAVEEETVVVHPRRWMPWLAAIAAGIAIVLLIPAFRNAFHRSPVDRLVALAPATGRVVEPRLTGGFRWSPYHGSERAAAGNATIDPARLKLGGAAGELVERAQHDPGAEAQHDAGVALVLMQSPDEAVARLEAAARSAPSARTWSDLAAARYAAAADLGRAALYPQGLAAADAALRLDPDLPEALFNRALIVERMGLAGEAREAWARYLAADPSSKWADEARTHLAELPAATTSSRFERDRPLLEEAAARGDAKGARTLVAAHAARARAFAEAEYLGRWGEAVLHQDAAQAERWLTISRGIGSAIALDASDTLLRDAVQAIDDAPAARRVGLAAAHAAYRSGRMAYSRQELEKAASDLDRAAAAFAQARSPMALAARYYAAGVHLAKNDGNAGAELQRILADVDASPGYRSLGAHVRWELGRARVFDYDWPGAAAVLSESAAMFRQAGDRANEAFVESMLAHCLASEGRGDDAWSARIAALRAFSAEGNPVRLAGAISDAMRAELLAGRNDSALALAQLARPVGGDAVQLSLVLDALQFQSMLESMMGNSDAALRTARQAASLAQSVADPSLRARRLADAGVATGAAMTVSDPRAAIASLTRAIDLYRRGNLPFALPEALLVRARCALRSGGAGAAAADLEEGMEIVERHRARVGGIVVGTGILDADHALFSESIRLHLDRGDDATAFAVAERSRGASVTVAELQQRLAGSATALLEIVVLPGEIVTFAITENDLQVGRRPTETATLATLVDASLSESGTTAAAALYDDLLRPVDAVLPRVRNVVIVPDPRLESVPFAALYDRAAGTYLVERAGVAIASSAGSLQRDGVRGSTSVATMTLPTGGATGTAALPQVEQELAEIAALYPRATAIAAGSATASALRDAVSAADVVHVAGHTERQPAGGEHALLLTASNGEGLERTSSRSIAATPLPHARLIVLAACETLRPPASAETHALSLGAAFVAAGAAGAIGTLTPVGDRDARTFFRTLHRQLAAGDDAGDALRAAQVTAIHEQKERGGSRAWRSMALLTGRIRTSKGKGVS